MQSQNAASNLLILSCSARKNICQENVEAWHLYDGVAFRVVKRHQREYGMFDLPDILIVSARYGLIKPATIIESYNQKMTLSLAECQQSNNYSVLQAFCARKRYQTMFIHAGVNYLAALGSIKSLTLICENVIVPSGGIGKKNSALKQWLSSLHLESYV